MLDLLFLAIIGAAFATLVAFVHACAALGADPAAAGEGP